MLTTRMKSAMTLMLQSEGYITLKDIADNLNVSTRTLLREIDSIETWVKENTGYFESKKGSGVRILGDTAEKQRLMDLLNEASSDLIFSPEERGIVIRAELLKSDEPLKLYILATYLNVVESTIAGDLVHQENWFESYDIKVIRRQGLGIMLKGDEKAKRKAIVSLMYEQISIYDFMDYIKSDVNREVAKGLSVKNKLHSSLMGLIDLDNIPQVSGLIDGVGTEVGFTYADNAFMALTLRFCVTLKRKEYWGQQLLTYQYRETLRKDQFYKSFRQWLMQDGSGILDDMPEEELLYLTMHMKGSKLRDTKGDSKISMIEDFRIIQLTKEFILAIEAETGIYLSDNEKLLFGLVKHLRPALYRMKMELDMINPLLMEIQVMYPKLFLAIRKCASVIEEKEHVQVSDDEVAYLATHIGAVIQKEDREIVKKFQVVIACMYGIGASQLLVANIEKNFMNLDIVNVVSVMDYKMNRVSLDQVDLVISTIPMEVGDTANVVVSPVLKQDDIIEISRFLKSYSPKNKVKAARSKNFLKEKLLILRAYGDIIINILDQFVFEKGIEVKEMSQVLEYASGTIAGTQEEKVLLMKGFIAREEKGSTILSKKGMLLLHCRADIAANVSLKIFQLKDPVEVQNEIGRQPINTIVVMVGPEKLNQQVLNVLSEITRCIITSDFSEMILRGNDNQSERELNRILDKFYQKQSNML